MSSSAFFTALALAGAAPDRLPPIDQCQTEPSLVAFREALGDAAKKRDVEALLRLTIDDVQTDFGGGSGKAEFTRHWRLDRPDQSGLWTELAAILGLGCTLDGSTAVIPSLSEPMDSLDAFETYVAIIPGSPLRREPREDSGAVAKLDWHLLTLKSATVDRRWFHVQLADGRSGYVRADEVRSPIDYRLVAERRGKRWLITAFVAGD